VKDFLHRNTTTLLLVMALTAVMIVSIIYISSNRAENLVKEKSEPVQQIVVDEQPPIETTDMDEVEEEIDPNLALNNLLAEWVVQEEAGDFGVVVQELGGVERRGEFNHDKLFVSASTYKLFVSYIILQEIERGNLDYTSLTNQGRTLDDCFDSLITYSWDVCAYPMGSLVGWPELQSRLVEDGYINTDINNYDSVGEFTGDKFTTAEDEALLMLRLAEGELLAQEETNYLINLLKNQEWRERIPAGVPQGIEVADKPGWLYKYENDAAIVYGEDVTYVMVVLSNESSVERIADLSAEVYAYFHPENSGQTE
jgi:beta-lactamase class A